MEYPKIQTLFKRDEKNIIIPTEFTLPEFEYLKDCKWECSEKIDGTSIRIYISRTCGDGGCSVIFKGRTDKADTPKHLLEKLHQLFPINKMNDFMKTINENVPEVILYGEGYGYKIQSGGGYIKNDVNFILFDVKIGKWWLNRKSCEQIASDLNIDIVPFIDYMSIPNAIYFVNKGFKSKISEDVNLDAEGLILKTPDGLLSRNGQRIITKLKTIDFKKLYGNK